MKKIIGALAVLLLFPTLLMAQADEPGTGFRAPGIVVKLLAPFVSVNYVVPAGTLCTTSGYQDGKIVAGCLAGVNAFGSIQGVQVSMDPKDVMAVYPKADVGGID